MTTLVLLAHLLGATAQAPPSLRIVVLEGEDAVNVIQQKSAVAPVIEVRDRNDLPVAGATVTFTIGGNTASFAGGVQTFTIATNAAGQAAAAALNPLASGAVQIQVAAAFQGQTAAATILQTNVLTAAQAAGAAGASGAGAAGGGGGISGTTVGIVGAAVAGGALAATQTGGGGEEPMASGPREFRGTFTFDITLTFQGCTRVESWSGQLIVVVAATAPLNGNAAINNGTLRVTAVTCTGGPQLGSTGTFFMGTTPLTGTVSDLGFKSEQSNTFPPGPNEAGGINTQGFAFSGVLNAADITGTLTHTRRIDSSGSSIPGTGNASAVVTLR